VSETRYEPTPAVNSLTFVTDSIVYLLVQGAFIALIVVPIIFKDVIHLTPTDTPFGAVI
jgi:hypothetical protein